MNSPKPDFIPDVQSSADTRHLAIDRVGIKGIRHPVKVKDKSVGVQHTIATFNMYVHLPHNFKGTHMSRFVEILNHHEREISVESFEQILGEMVERLEAKSGYIEMSFPYFVNKSAPVSGVQSLLDYDVTLIGETVNGNSSVTMKVLVPVTSLCPCSKKISERGAHDQRSHVTLSIRTNEFVWIEDVIRIAEDQASCELYGLLKRPTRSSSPNAPMTIRNSSRTWCAMWPQCWTRISVSMPISWSRKISNRYTTIPPMRSSSGIKRKLDRNCGLLVKG